LFALALERAGLSRTRLHDLRHAAATFLLAQGFTL
jgi:site-specific recombinase XerD